MNEKDTLETLEILKNGNTTSKSQSIQLYKWCFTFNNYEKNDIIEIKNTFNSICKKYVFQEETGENGTKHLQGSIWLNKKMRPSEFKLSKKIHWEKMRNEKACENYCSKENTRTGEIFTLGFPKPLKLITNLYPWQQNIKDICLTEPDDRTINWYWEPIGNIGKTQFIKYMIFHHKVLYCCKGKYADIINLAFNQDMNETDVVMFNLPKEDKAKISYSALECIKDGLICNTKFETGSKIFNSPHVFVFSNFPPDTEKLSKDRWNIVELKVGELGQESV